MRYRLVTGIDHLFEENINKAAEEGWTLYGYHAAVQLKDQYNDAMHYSAVMVKNTSLVYEEVLESKNVVNKN